MIFDESGRAQVYAVQTHQEWIFIFHLGLVHRTREQTHSLSVVGLLIQAIYYIFLM